MSLGVRVCKGVWGPWMRQDGCYLGGFSHEDPVRGHEPPLLFPSGCGVGNNGLEYGGDVLS